MTKSELLQLLIDQNPDLRPKEVRLVIETFFNQIRDHLAKGGRVEIRGFGVFSTRWDRARQKHNPRTGEAVILPVKRRPHFRPGLDIQNRLASAIRH